MGTGRQTSPPDTAINIRAFIDNAPFSNHQRLLLLLCFITVSIDGFDVNALAVAAPQIRREMDLEPGQIGLLFGVGTIAGMTSLATVSWLADRLGRRPLILASLISSGVLSTCLVFATNFTELLMLRFAASFCFTGAVTGAYAYAADVAPKRATAKAVIITSTGFGSGVAAAGFLSGPLIDFWGWHGVFYFAGGATLLVAAIIWIALPESPAVEALRANSAKRIAAFLRKVDPRATFAADQRFYLDEEVRAGPAYGILLRDGRAWPFLGLCTSAFFINFAIYSLVKWLPLIVTDAGGSPYQAGNSLGVFKLGGIVSSLLLAAYIDKQRNPLPVLTAILLFALIPLAGLGVTDATTLAFIMMAAVAGVSLGGPQYAWNALMARTLPASLRGSGLGAYRIFTSAGAGSGPVIAGLLFQAGWGTREVLLALIGPVAVAAVIVTGMWLRERLVMRAEAAA